MIVIQAAVKLVGSGTSQQLHLPKSASEFGINRRCHDPDLLNIIDAVENSGGGP